MTRLESCLTAPGVEPVGEGWRCIHSSVSPDGTAWWLWQREPTPAQLAARRDRSRDPFGESASGCRDRA